MGIQSHGKDEGYPDNQEKHETMNKTLIAALIAGLMSAGSSALADNVDQNPTAGRTSTVSNVSGPGAGVNGRFQKMRGAGRQSLKEALGLSDRQEARIIELRRNHFEKALSDRRELFRLQSELRTESMNKRPDEKRVAALSEQIGRQHVKLAMLESRHLKDLASVLDRKQVDTFLKMREVRWDKKGRI
jgi:Spy/CpxP family protein refolding chaperone